MNLPAINILLFVNVYSFHIFSGVSPGTSLIVFSAVFEVAVSLQNPHQAYARHLDSLFIQSEGSASFIQKILELVL